MTDREKYSWAVTLLAGWAFPVLALVLTVPFGQTPNPAVAMYQMGWLALVNTSLWLLTLAFRGVYLSGKRKGNQ